jgi:hypothetical protein
VARLDGRYYEASKKNTGDGIFTEIEEDLRNLYVAGISVPESDRDGKFHQLKVEAAREAVKDPMPVECRLRGGIIRAVRAQGTASAGSRMRFRGARTRKRTC